MVMFMFDLRLRANCKAGEGPNCLEGSASGTLLDSHSLSGCGQSRTDHSSYADNAEQ